MKRVLALIGLLAASPASAIGDDSAGRHVSVGEHRLFVYCTGQPSAITVILENGLGAGLETWRAVQSAVAEFARVCSYDRAGEGHSSKPKRPQTPQTRVADLHRLLKAIHEPGPYVLVAASLGGVYVRAFAQKYPAKTAGIVLVDSSHEEQYSHYLAISPSIAEKYATQEGRFPKHEFLRAAGQLEPGKRLQWRMDVPLVVLEHKRLNGPVRTDWDRLAVDWHDLQVDLASRSKHGRLIETSSGHFIPGEQPGIIVDSIRELIRDAAEVRRSGNRR